MAAEKIEKIAEGASTGGAEYDTIAAQVAKAVEEMPADASTVEEPEKAKTPTGDAAETQPKEETPPETKGDGDGAFTVGDAEIERAVKAGLSVADARAFTDKGVFERVCAALEAKNAPPADGGENKISKDSVEKPKDGDGDSADFDIPELTEDEEFDPKLVKLSAAVRKMGDALKSLREENNSLRERVGKSEEEAHNAEREAEKAKALEERRSLRIAKPGGVSGTRKEKTEEDALAEVAGIVSSKFNI